jgi:hypothetical protein
MIPLLLCPLLLVLHFRSSVHFSYSVRFPISSPGSFVSFCVFFFPLRLSVLNFDTSTNPFRASVTAYNRRFCCPSTCGAFRTDFAISKVSRLQSLLFFDHLYYPFFLHAAPPLRVLFINLPRSSSFLPSSLSRLFRPPLLYFVSLPIHWAGLPTFFSLLVTGYLIRRPPVPAFCRPFCAQHPSKECLSPVERKTIKINFVADSRQSLFPSLILARLQQCNVCCLLSTRL